MSRHSSVRFRGASGERRSYPVLSFLDGLTQLLISGALGVGALAVLLLFLAKNFPYLPAQISFLASRVLG